MTREVLWFVLSGFVLGFAVSTFWEWLYYRGRRLQWRDQRVAELEAKLAKQRTEQPELPRAIRPDEQSTATDDAAIAPSASPFVHTPIYRSQAALLRSEQKSQDEHS